MLTSYAKLSKLSLLAVYFPKNAKLWNTLRLSVFRLTHNLFLFFQKLSQHTGSYVNVLPQSYFQCPFTVTMGHTRYHVNHRTIKNCAGVRSVLQRGYETCILCAEDSRCLQVFDHR